MVLEEADVTRAFHSILKDALAQATAEGLLDEQALLHGGGSSAEDLRHTMLTRHGHAQTPMYR